jgi:uncharacterized membrane protein
MTATPASSTWERRINNAAAWGLRHWLLFANGLVLLYAGLPWLSPLARAAGYDRLGRALFLLYAPLCHQRPERSFEFYGYQVAYCHRCTAMYTALLAAGLLFGLLRGRIRPAPPWIGGLLLLPMLIDGGTHLIDDVLGAGLRGGGDAIGTPNFALRMLTGALFGIMALIALYPRLERDFRNSATLVSGANGSRMP